MPIFSVQPAWELAEDCLDLHYPSWDTLGRENSSIPQDIEAAGARFCLVELEIARVSGIDNPGVEIDAEKIRAFRSRIREDGGSAAVPAPVLNGDLEPIDGWHRTIALHEEGVAAARFWIPDAAAQLLG